MFKRRIYATAALWAAAPWAGGQTRVDLRTQAKSIDFSAAESTKPSKVGTALPATCSVGEEFFHSGAAAGQNQYGCTAPNTWTPLGGPSPGQQITDFGLNATPAVLSMRNGTRLFGSASLYNGGCTYTINSGSANGLAYVYFTDSGQVVLEHPAGAGQIDVTAAGTSCAAAAVTTPGWPSGMNFHPVGTVMLSAGHWDVVTQYPVLTAGWYTACGAHLLCNYANGTAVVDVAPTVMTSGGANQVTGSVDASQAQYFAVPQAAADPESCGTAGQLFFNTTAGVLKASTAAGNPCPWAPVSAAGGNVVLNWSSYNQVVITQGPGSAADSGKLLPAGALVGTSDAQTLSNKTLAAPALTAYTVAALPAPGTANRLVLVADGAGAGDCTVGGGSFTVLCRATAAGWEPLGGGAGGGVSGSGLTAGHVIAGGGGSAVADSGIPVASVMRTDADNVLGAYAWDAAGTASTRPARTAAGSPAGRDPCATGEQYFQTDAATAGANTWLCTAVDTWTQLRTAGAVSLNAANIYGASSTNDFSASTTPLRVPAIPGGGGSTASPGQVSYNTVTNAAVVGTSFFANSPVWHTASSSVSLSDQISTDGATYNGNASVQGSSSSAVAFQQTLTFPQHFFTTGKMVKVCAGLTIQATATVPSYQLVLALGSSNLWYSSLGGTVPPAGTSGGELCWTIATLANGDTTTTKMIAQALMSYPVVSRNYAGYGINVNTSGGPLTMSLKLQFNATTQAGNNAALQYIYWAPLN